ncbi:MAG: exodeoxyribonuclease III [Candidatus Thermoplasmatota archaeon]
MTSQIQRILSWNVNGLRAIEKKGFFSWFQKESPDILCLQEIKATPEQLPPHLRNPPGYRSYFNPGERKGYSGVAVFTKQKPVSIKKGFGIQKFDSEGRILILEYSNFILFNIYFPNGKKNHERLTYKLDFYNTFLKYADMYKEQGNNIIICGDVNTAHTEIDLARPKENEKISGFLPVERAWIDTLLSHGYLDTFRVFNHEPHQYTWWDMKTNARERNIGWRIDYFFINKELLPHLTKAFIMQDILGSDHCPIGIELSSI